MARIDIGAHVSLSYRTFLCTGSHDPRDAAFPLTLAPIVVEDQAWLAADVFVHPGVRIGEGAVVGARATVTRDIPPNTISAGSPSLVRGSRLATKSRFDQVQD